MIDGADGTEPVKCSQCDATPASTRDVSPHLPVCDSCAQLYVAWRCPVCGQNTHGRREDSDVTGPCIWCEPVVIWEAQTQETRDEIDRALVERSNIMAIKRIRELTGCGIRDASMIHSNRWEHLRSSESDA